jgi:hypothetical protein
LRPQNNFPAPLNRLRLYLILHPLFHIRGFAAPETKAAAEQARLLIEKAEALGEPLEDPLLLFSVLFGFWVANYLAFNGDVMRDLARPRPRFDAF